MKRLLLNYTILALLMAVFSSCSVAMAAKKEGTSLNQVQQCKTRTQFLGCGGKVVSSERTPNGNIVEVYQFKKERGSAARALMHGVLDVSTCGLWEAIGTPIEACDSTEYFSTKVTYDRNENVVDVSLR